MKKSIKLVLVVVAIVVLPLMAAGMQGVINDKEVLLDFIEYCKTCENLRQVNPAKDYTKASLHELKSAAPSMRSRMILQTAPTISIKQKLTRLLVELIMQE